MRQTGRWWRIVGVIVGLMLLWGARPIWAAPTRYVVQPGDSLTSIARAHGVSVQQLAAANGLGSYAWVYVGQRLTIPGTGAAPAPAPSGGYIVQPGDTLTTIALRHGVRLRDLAAANGLGSHTWVYVGQRLEIPGGPSDASAPGEGAPSEEVPGATDPGVHVVQAGENLFRIGLRYGTTAAALRAANGLSSNTIYVGQRLTIPNGGDTGAPAPATPAPQAPASGEKWIDVNLTTQTVTAYEGQTAVYTARASTGTWRTPTVVGTYRVYAKYAATHMSGPGYSLPNVPYTMYFYRGYALHGTYWHSNFGTPMSHGCVNLATPDARWFYLWAPIGTKVVSHH
jgi:LysM repeat protein